MTFIETILDELLQLFKREGIEANTDAEIIRKLDIRQSTFNELFADRQDMVMKVAHFDIEQGERRKAEMLKNAANPVAEIMLLLQDGIQTMRDLNPVYITDLMQFYPEVWNKTLEYVSANNQEVNAEILNRGVVEGYFRKDINLQLVTKIIFEQFVMMLNPAIFPPQKYDLAEVFRSIYFYYVRGICTDNGSRLAEEFFAKSNL